MASIQNDEERNVYKIILMLHQFYDLNNKNYQIEIFERANMIIYERKIVFLSLKLQLYDHFKIEYVAAMMTIESQVLQRHE